MRIKTTIALVVFIEKGVFDFAGSKTRVEYVFVSLYLPKDCFSGHGFPCHYIVDWWVTRW